MRFTDCTPDLVFLQRFFATLPGVLMAGAGRFDVAFRSKGGHGGLDATAGQDLAMVQAQFLIEVEAHTRERRIAGHYVSATVAFVHGGVQDIYNVLPTEIRLQGSTRGFDDEELGAFHHKIKAMAEAIAGQSASASVANVHTTIGVPPLSNSSRETEFAVRAAQATVGNERVVTKGKPVTASEDFAFFLDKVPGAFVFLGNGVSDDGSFSNIHTPLFDFNDAVLPIGIQYWINLVNEELSVG